MAIQNVDNRLDRPIADTAAPTGPCLSPLRWPTIMVLAAIAATISLHRSATVHPIVYQYSAGDRTMRDIWFDADLPVRACMMDRRDSPQQASSGDHALMPVAFFVPAHVLRTLAGTGRIGSFRWTAAMHAALWMATFAYLLFRIGCRPFDTAVFSVLALSSAAATFWTSVPEWFVLSGTTLLVPLAVAAVPPAQGFSESVRYTLASAICLSATFTNWFIGIVATIFASTHRRWLQWNVNAFVIVSACWWVQARWFPRAEFILGNRRLIQMWEGLPEPGTADALVGFFIHSMIMPPTDRRERFGDALSVQFGLSFDSAWAWIAGALWLMLLAVGCVQLYRKPATTLRFRLLLCGALLFQLVLHIFIGLETFLFSMQFIPLMVLIVAISAREAMRVPVLSMTLALTLLAATNNSVQFRNATSYISALGAEAARQGTTFSEVIQCEDEGVDDYWATS